MAVQSKEIFIVMGASRTGKGTLLAALHGVKMKYFRKDKTDRTFSDLEVTKQAAGNAFMAPVDDDGMPEVNSIISHKHNSHTLGPKFVPGSPNYPQDYSALQNIYSVDYPGLFESKGPELDISMQLTL